MVKSKLIALFALIAAGFALGVIGLGAFTRLVDAGLGCPDWPGCYGQFVVDGSKIVSSTFVAYKAWAEMIHRYFAGSLGLLILLIVMFIFTLNELRKRSNVILGSALILLLIYQILLGQWTVTLKLWPVIVTQHLLGGFFILSILWLIYLNNTISHSENRESVASSKGKSAIYFAYFGVLLLLIQITLGAWTSTHYASLSCPDFPFCFNDHAVNMHWRAAFHLASIPGMNYEGGILPDAVRQTIHMMHRIGALLISSYLFIFSFYALSSFKNGSLQRLILILLVLLLIQLCIGITNVIFKLPLATALAHNLIASLLLLTMLTVLFRLIQYRKSRVLI